MLSALYAKIAKDSIMESKKSFIPQCWRRHRRLFLDFVPRCVDLDGKVHVRLVVNLHAQVDHSLQPFGNVIKKGKEAARDGGSVPLALVTSPLHCVFVHHGDAMIDVILESIEKQAPRGVLLVRINIHELLFKLLHHACTGPAMLLDVLQDGLDKLPPSSSVEEEEKTRRI